MFPSTWRWVSYTRVVITIFPGTETRWAAFWGPDESTEYQDSSDINCGTKGFLVQKNCHYLFHCLAVWQYLGLFPPKKMIRKFIISMYSWQVSFGDCRVPFFNIRDPVTVVVWNALDKHDLACRNWTAGFLPSTVPLTTGTCEYPPFCRLTPHWLEVAQKPINNQTMGPHGWLCEDCVPVI